MPECVMQRRPLSCVLMVGIQTLLEQLFYKSGGRIAVCRLMEQSPVLSILCVIKMVSTHLGTKSKRSM